MRQAALLVCLGLSGCLHSREELACQHVAQLRMCVWVSLSNEHAMLPSMGIVYQNSSLFVCRVYGFLGYNN